MDLFNISSDTLVPLTQVLLCVLSLLLFTSTNLHLHPKLILIDLPNCVLPVFRSLVPPSPLPFLPSAPSLPLLGHILSISPSAPWRTFALWSKAHGAAILVHMTTLGSTRPMVVLNTVQSAHDLLEVKGKNFSGRPRMAFFNDWLGWKNALGFIQHDENHRKQRRLIRPHMSPHAITNHHPMIIENVQSLMDNLAQTPDDFSDHILDYVSCVVVMFTYGYKFTSQDDPRRSMVDTIGRLMIEVEWAVLMVLDIFPFIARVPSWLPFMGAKRSALRGNALRQEMSESFFGYVQEQRAAGTERPSLISQVLDDLDGEREKIRARSEDSLSKEMENTVMNIGTMMYLAGVETTNAALSTFLLAMVLHPHVARRAQQEIDEVFHERTPTPSRDLRHEHAVSWWLPSFDDRKRLPYVECLLKEVLRWNPPAPLGVSHSSVHDDEYNGMIIPGGCSVVTNIWYMCHDEAEFDAPEDFNPGRFTDLVNGGKNAASGISSKTTDPTNIIFGFGRRICPGEHIADAILWTCIVSILANFDILPGVDGASGEEVMPCVAFTSGSLSRPEPFKCRILPRH